MSTLIKPLQIVDKIGSDEEEKTKSEDEDTETKKSGDEDTDEKKDEDDDEEKKKSEGMDAKIKHLSSKIDAIGRLHTKDLLIEVSKRDELAKKLSHHIGTFDHAEKTLAEVAEYGVKKLGLPCQKGHEQPTLNGFFAAKAAPKTTVMDRKFKADEVDAYFDGGE